MPLVTVHYWRLDQDDRKRLAKALPGIVSKALHIEAVPEAHLTPDDIEVLFLHGSEHDVNQGCHFGINVEAMHFNERELIVQKVAETIASEVKAILAQYLKFYAWVTLPPAGYAEGRSAVVSTLQERSLE